AGDDVLDDAVVLGPRRAAGAGRGDHGPVEAAAAPARAVELEDERHLVEVGVGAGPAVVDVADHDQLGDAVAVDVGNDGSAVIEGGSVLHPAVGITAQVRGEVDIDAHLAPDLGPHRVGVVVDGVGRELVAVPVEGGDVVRGGGAEDLL